MKVDHELAILVKIADVVFLGIVRHEPVDEAQTHGAGAGQYRHHLFKTPRLIVEILEPADNEILFSLDAILGGLTSRGVHPLTVWWGMGLDGHRVSVGIVEG